MHDNFLRKFLDWFLSIWRNFFRLLDKRLRAQQKFCIWFDEKHYMCHILWLVLRIFCIYCDKKWDLIKYFFKFQDPSVQRAVSSTQPATLEEYNPYEQNTTNSGGIPPPGPPQQTTNSAPAPPPQSYQPQISAADFEVKYHIWYLKHGGTKICWRLKSKNFCNPNENWNMYSFLLYDWTINKVFGSTVNIWKLKVIQVHNFFATKMKQSWLQNSRIVKDLYFRKFEL